MSLKAFHVVFITASVLLAFGLGAWSFVKFADAQRTMDLVYGFVSIGIGVGLVAYGRYFLRKLKNISYL